MLQPKLLKPIYTIYDISSETGVPVKTIKNWTTKKLVPKAGSRGQGGVNYTETHMKRVIKVRDWLESRITLDEMAERIEFMGEKALDVADPYADDDDWAV